VLRGGPASSKSIQLRATLVFPPSKFWEPVSEDYKGLPADTPPPLFCDLLGSVDYGHLACKAMKLHGLNYSVGT
jgi:hypothetical protein